MLSTSPGRCFSVLLLVVTAAAIPAVAQPVDFNRDIRPILSDNCFACHGPDGKSRETDLRLDVKQSAFGEMESGEFAIVPGKLGDSALYERITTDDEFERMPPPDSGKSLTPEQIALFKRWIEQGAPWREHWSFETPKRPAPPKVKRESSVRNDIDRFVLARLEKDGLAPAAETDRRTLLRRVTLDLTGLPPTIKEVEAFLADKSPDAYEKVVDRLLASPRYGEHAARHWLDAARYGDTHGLHLDNERSIWPYRDWVIAALNDNMPFDQFTIEQLAGDLLENPTTQQLIATGFNRCNVTTSEGGSIAEEYIVRYAVDRVETTSTVWLGLTMGCAVCHEHKFDPFSQKEFYQVYAFFNSTQEKAMDGNALLPAPALGAPTPLQLQQQKASQARIADIEKQIQTALAKIQYAEPKGETVPKAAEPQEHVWVEDALPPGTKGEGNTPWQFVSAPDHPVLSGTKSHTRTAEGLSQHYFTGASAPLKIGEGDKLFVHVFLDPKNPPKEIMIQLNDGSWEHRAYWGENLIPWGKLASASRRPMGDLPEAGKWVRLEVDPAALGLAPGTLINGWAFTQFGGTVHWDKAGIVSIHPPGGAQFASFVAWDKHQRSLEKPALPKEVAAAIKIEPAKRNAAQQKTVRDHFLQYVYTKTRPAFDPLNKEVADTQQQLVAMTKSFPRTLVTRALAKPRDAFILERGEYDKRKDKVKRDVPAALPPLPKDAPRNRLGFARWLVDPSHPLTARVTVNRYWQQYFGTGIVKTAEDFGSQGEWPSHPQLLDWLATEFIASGWDVKHLHRLIVTSATYRQSSRITPESFAADPNNRLLARGPRFRMDAEMVRDNALAVSGLLVEKIGGKSVKPYQPLGLWKAVGYTSSNTANFRQDSGDALYRRSMYTFWKRTSPPPTMALLDAPSRETCTVRRERTNTPLAALALMNDVQFVEAARHLAQRMMTEGGDTPQERIAFAFQSATARLPDEMETKVLLEQYQANLAVFQKDKPAAQKLIGVGDSKPNETLDASELAAWTIVANVILNLDETVTKL